MITAKPVLTTEELKDQLHIDYLHAFSGPHGEAVLADLRRYCGFDACLYVKGSFDHTAYNLAGRDFFLYILDALKDRPEEPAQTEVKTESSLDS